ncbi:PQQ-binding-like beta-propeller repeat protein [Prosthecobacter sp.]|uniref:PQQ-binding-like beta-propeller repeat protein n=1 Tax=Prosthecobacter sp. TaxID=1965333 RepID=UPI003784018C
MSSPSLPTKAVRWKPGVRIAVLGLVTIIGVQCYEEWPFQKRNLISYEVGLAVGAALVIWWLFLSRVRMAARLGVMGAVFLTGVVFGALVKIGGVTGDLVPILKWRWSQGMKAAPAGQVSANSKVPRADFPQFYGAERNGVLAGPRLASDWKLHPPQMVWRHAIGAGWSGFAVVGQVCVTQEQNGEKECVTAYDLNTGRQIWTHEDEAHYNTTIGGEGPHATPTIAQGRVFTLGATGILNCLELADGRPVWNRNVVQAVEGKTPGWGMACSPLMVDDLVIVHGGEGGTHSLVALRSRDGEVVWKAGRKPSYATPIYAKLAGVPQVLAFHDGSVAGHDVKTGAELWQRPWGNGNVVCASPIVIGEDEALFSSGYGVGAELLKISRQESGLKVESLWHSTKMKAKFAHLFAREGCVFGLDDGMFACVDLKDGSKQWREGRHGHGQGLVVGEHYLLMAETGELVLLRPTRAAPNEQGRFQVFNSKTWNPIALVGDLLLVRNDREAACLRLAVE